MATNARVSYHVKVEGIDALLAKTEGDKLVKTQLRKLIRKAGNLTRNEMRRRAPRGKRQRGGAKRTPLYRRIKLTVNRDLEAKINPGGRVAHLLEDGVRSHTIRPKSKRALRFGEFVRRQATHPGIAAQPFVDSTRRVMEPQIDTLMRDGMREIEQEWAGK